jgi:hypothetical protein
MGPVRRNCFYVMADRVIAGLAHPAIEDLKGPEVTKPGGQVVLGRHVAFRAAVDADTVHGASFSPPV